MGFGDITKKTIQKQQNNTTPSTKQETQEEYETEEETEYESEPEYNNVGLGIVIITVSLIIGAIYFGSKFGIF